MKAPIFVFSLPRAGSTLLQRVLMSHEKIHSVAEPWILLPQVYALKKEGILSEYSSYTAHTGISDFIENLPEKEEDYRSSLRNFIMDLYAKQCKNNENYFLDKTPRYYLIIDEIVELFPEAKFIYLFRNPIHVYASIVNTWGNKRFNKLFSTYNDIILGTSRLSNAYLKFKHKSYALKYEDFVLDPAKEVEKVFEYLNLEYNSHVISNFTKQNTKGNLGDPTGVKQYSKISSEGLNKWQSTFNSFLRKKFALMLMKKIKENDLKTQGYNKRKIIEEIKALKNKKWNLFFLDLFDYFTSGILRKLKLNLFINKNFSWVKRKYLS